MAEWYYAQKGTRNGPVTKEEIEGLIKDGTLDGDSELWREGMSDWTSLKQTELKSALVAPPPLKGDAVSGTVVWLLAFAPFIGTILEFSIAHNRYQDDLLAQIAVYNGDYFYVTILLNVVLCVIDNGILKKAGYRSNKLTGWVWLVPVYLYQRGNVTNTGKGYFWAWIAVFILSMLISTGQI